jgi:O-antigen/teichoic acid export membrane protein
MVASASAVVLLLVAGSELVLPLLRVPSRFSALLSLAALLVVVQVTESALINFLRADQETMTLMQYQVAKRYLGLALILGAVLLISATLTAYYAATLLTEATAVGLLAAFMFRRGRRPWPRYAEFSGPLCRALLQYGIPMMFGYELSGITLMMGGRYVIGGMIGDAPLGLYSAAYNLCQYVQAAVITSVGQAVVPLYLNMWDRKGEAETSAFIGRSLRVYVMVGAALMAGLAAVGPELLPALASDKYESAAPVIPWVISGMVVDGGTSMLGAGLFIQRRSRTIMAVVLSCAVLNVALNLLLVPRWNIVGSAVATLVSYAATAVAMAIAARPLLRVQVPWVTIIRAAIAAGAMYWIVVHAHLTGRWPTVGVKVLVGAAAYVGFMVLIDSDARALVRNVYERVRPRATRVGK